MKLITLGFLQCQIKKLIKLFLIYNLTIINSNFGFFKKNYNITIKNNYNNLF